MNFERHDYTRAASLRTPRCCVKQRVLLSRPIITSENSWMRILISVPGQKSWFIFHKESCLRDALKRSIAFALGKWEIIVLGHVFVPNIFFSMFPGFSLKVLLWRFCILFIPVIKKSLVSALHLFMFLISAMFLIFCRDVNFVRTKTELWKGPTMEVRLLHFHHFNLLFFPWSFSVYF